MPERLPVFTLEDLMAMAEAPPPETVEARWVVQSGQTPLEFLASVYRTPTFDPRDRINAAKAILEYSHRKVPSKLEVDGKVVNAKLDIAQLKGLTDDELGTLIQLLEKAN
jgi:hypothetical protein